VKTRWYHTCEVRLTLLVYRQALDQLKSGQASNSESGVNYLQSRDRQPRILHFASQSWLGRWPTLGTRCSLVHRAREARGSGAGTGPSRAMVGDVHLEAGTPPLLAGIKNLAPMRARQRFSRQILLDATKRGWPVKARLSASTMVKSSILLLGVIGLPILEAVFCSHEGLYLENMTLRIEGKP